MVSVIVPNYNHAQYLNKRIDSVLDQTYQDFELIILDDCSTDNSRDIIEQYRHNPKISRIVYNVTNSGSTYRQWRKGIELAKGEYIWIAESDDWAQPCFLEQLVASFDQTISLAFCQSRRFRNESEILHNTTLTHHNEIDKGLDFIQEKMLAQNWICNASMAVFRKEYVTESILDKMTKMLYCGDWLFWMHLAAQGNVVEFSEYYNYFRQHPHKVTSRAQKQGLDFIEGTKVLKYAEKAYGVRVSSKVLTYWSKLWLRLRLLYDTKIEMKTFWVLIKYNFSFSYRIPYCLLKMKMENLKHK